MKRFFYIILPTIEFSNFNCYALFQIIKALLPNINTLGYIAIVFLFSGCNNNYNSYDYEPPPEKTVQQYRDIAIMGHGKASYIQLANFFFSNNKRINRKFILNLANLYIQEAGKEGVNSDVAFCQMCIETNFLRFGGQVKPSQNNFAGIGSTDNGAKGAYFKTIKDGVRAQIQHLKAYASCKPLNYRVVDPRFKYVQRGSAKYVSQLGNGNWATDPNYAKKIILKIYQMYRLNKIN